MNGAFSGHLSAFNLDAVVKSQISGESISLADHGLLMADRANPDKRLSG